MKLPSPSSHVFSQVPRATIERSSFNRSFTVKSTFDAGLLVPFLVDPIVPGDTFNVRMAGFARLATPIKPIMDNLYIDTFFFFVPYRLVWSNFVKFMGEQANPGDSVSFVIPTCTVPKTPPIQGLADYFGLPVTGTAVYGAHLKISCLPFRAYRLIWNQWFRDENLQNSQVVNLGDGPDDSLNDIPLRRGKRHDYFTSCLPFLQKGQAVTVPLGTSAPLQRTATAAGFGVPILEQLSTPANYGPAAFTSTGQQAAMAVNTALAGGSGTSLTPVGALAWKGGSTGLYADLSAATASTINDLRIAWQIQRLYERDARGGTRYTEIVRSHFGVLSPDARLQRAEYLGGGSSPIFVAPVAQTTPLQIPPTGVTPIPAQSTFQGNLSGVGTSSFQNHGFVKSFTEHGLLIGLLSVRADLTYQQGIERWWTAQTKLDQYWPVLAHVGEQAVLNKEIYYGNVAGTGAGQDDGVFGYQERYAEYRYKPSRITGKFRSDYALPLDVWHLAQDFGALPLLNDAFIQDVPPVGRVVAVPSEPHFLFDAFISMKCARPMPVYGVPGGVDHF